MMMMMRCKMKFWESIAYLQCGNAIKAQTLGMQLSYSVHYYEDRRSYYNPATLG